MKLLQKLCRDEAGAILSSELVLVGTLGVVGATVGLSAISTAVNEELEDVAFAIRSLDQSYEVTEVRGHSAWTAGSSFKQEPVKESLRELDEQIDRMEAEAAKKQELEKKDDDGEMKKQPAAQPQPKKKPGKKKKKAADEQEEEVVL